MSVISLLSFGVMRIFKFIFTKIETHAHKFMQKITEVGNFKNALVIIARLIQQNCDRDLLRAANEQ